MKEALAVDNLAVALCLMMAQQRYCVVYRETEKSHLKLVGKLYDQVSREFIHLESLFYVEISVLKNPDEKMVFEIMFFLLYMQFHQLIIYIFTKFSVH